MYYNIFYSKFWFWYRKCGFRLL